MKNITAMFFGVLTTASVISILHVVQGIVLDDWSGVHPFYRIFQLPLIVAVGFFMGGFAVSIIRLLKIGRIVKVRDFYILGLILGFVGIGNLLHPWLHFEYTDWIVIFFVFFVSVLAATRFSLRS